MIDILVAVADGILTWFDKADKAIKRVESDDSSKIYNPFKFHDPETQALYDRIDWEITKMQTVDQPSFCKSGGKCTGWVYWFPNNCYCQKTETWCHFSAIKPGPRFLKY